MNAKRTVTAALLLFVVASLAWFGVKEALHARAVKAARENRSASTAPTVPPATVFPAATPQTVQGTPEVAPRAPAPAKAQPQSATTAAPATPAAKDRGSKVMVYYLHTTARCPNCLKIEAYTAAEMTGALAGPLSAGQLEWKVLNVDEPENAHFVEDYQLYTKSVVVSDIKDGKEVRWKRLDKVWDYLDDRQAFMKYVDEEVRAYLNGTS